MCNIRVNTDVLLANLFAVQNKSISMTALTKYLDFISNMTPYYVATDFDEAEVRRVVERYPTLYFIVDDEDGNLRVYPGDRKPNLKYFNSMYSTAWANYLGEITKSFSYCI